MAQVLSKSGDGVFLGFLAPDLEKFFAVLSSGRGLRMIWMASLQRAAVCRRVLLADVWESVFMERCNSSRQVQASVGEHAFASATVRLLLKLNFARCCKAHKPAGSGGCQDFWL